MKRASNNQGVAMLEFAVSATFLLLLVTGAFGLIDYVRRARAVNEQVELALSDDGIKPLTIALDVNGSGIFVRREAIREYLASVVAKVSQRLLPLVESNGQQNNLYIDASYSVVHLDPDTGALVEVEQIETPTLAHSGALTVPAQLSSKMDLSKEFLGIAQEKIDPMSLAALLAVPSGSFGFADGSQHYLPISVLVGVRAFLSLKGSLAGEFMPLIGSNPILSGIKAVALRGELE